MIHLSFEAVDIALGFVSGWVVANILPHLVQATAINRHEKHPRALANFHGNTISIADRILDSSPVLLCSEDHQYSIPPEAVAT